MFATNDIGAPYNAYPRDVTSPGPDQRPGVVKAHRIKPLTEEVRRPPLPKKKEEKEDQPVEAPDDKEK